ncbi:MAG TPA: hypothetical protein DCQ51_12850 [Planktothrix sp. UBA8407]|nr:hypothetical protein [Planktothrix sp. UBA8407]HBK21458.1 hypothetical protein [Planktothrix sp. UBA10369]
MANRWNPQQIAPFIPHQPKRYGVGIPVGQAKSYQPLKLEKLPLLTRFYNTSLLEFLRESDRFFWGLKLSPVGSRFRNRQVNFLKYGKISGGLWGWFPSFASLFIRFRSNSDRGVMWDKPIFHFWDQL